MYLDDPIPQPDEIPTTTQDDLDTAIKDLEETLNETEVVPPTQEEADAGSPDEWLAQEMRSLQTEVQQLRHDFETKLMYDESKERQISNLHQELQSYRAGLHFRILQPVLVDLISMFDDLHKLIGSLAQEESAPGPERMASNLRSFQDTILEMLQRQGVESYEVEEETFVAGRQRVVKAVETADLELDKKVIRRLRRGFEYEGKMLRPEWVEAYKYVPARSM